MDNTLEQSLARLACSCRILELEGHGDMTLGRLSLRDPQQRGSSRYSSSPDGRLL